MVQYYSNDNRAALSNFGEASTFTATSAQPILSYGSSGQSIQEIPISDNSPTSLSHRDDSESSDEEYGHIRLLTEHVDALSLATDVGLGFHGKSSVNGVLNQAAQTIPSLSRAMNSTAHPKVFAQQRPIFWTVFRVSRLASFFLDSR